MKLNEHFSFWKKKDVPTAKAKFFEDLKGSIKEVALAKQGRIKLQSAREFLKEL